MVIFSTCFILLLLFELFQVIWRFFWRSKSGTWILDTSWAALIIFSFAASSASLWSIFSSRQGGCCSLLEEFELVHHVIQSI